MREHLRGVRLGGEHARAISGVTVRADGASPIELIERSRRRIACDLHDGPAQALAAALLQLEILEEHRNNGSHSREVDHLRNLLQEALEEVLSLAADLRSAPADAAAGLKFAIEQHVEKVRSRTNMDIELEIDDGVSGLTPSARIAVFRVVQEALTNAYVHGGATECRVAVHMDESSLQCMVADNGSGFDVEATMAKQGSSHLGLRGMAERASMLDGHLTVASIPDHGTTIIAKIPRWRA